MTAQPIHVLIVDDEESVRTPLAEHLEKNYKYDVETAANAAEALKLLQITVYDVALIDQVLEGEISGQELLQKIKANFPEIQVIALTGWMMDEGISVLRMGAYRYFAKPFNLEELALTIKFAAEESQTRRERQYLQSLFSARSEITSPRDPKEVLHNIVYEAQQATGAWQAVIVLVAENGGPRILVSSNLDHKLDATTSTLLN